jgi:hypothetical protein
MRALINADPTAAARCRSGSPRPESYGARADALGRDGGALPVGRAVRPRGGVGLIAAERRAESRTRFSCNGRPTLCSNRLIDAYRTRTLMHTMLASFASDMDDDGDGDGGQLTTDAHSLTASVCTFSRVSLASIHGVASHCA